MPASRSSLALGSLPPRRLLKDPVSGLTHLVGCGVGALGAVLLLARCAGGHGSVIACAIYGATLVALYAASSVYHLVDAGPVLTRRLRLFDHLAIFLLVAGTCTPIFHHAFAGRERVVMLSMVWALAALGIGFKLLWSGAPRWLYTAVYLAMGWGVVVRWSHVAGALPHASLALVLAGGVAYSLGAVVYAVKRPDPFPRVFGFHEIWHLFVMLGSSLHYAAIVLLT